MINTAVYSSGEDSLSDSHVIDILPDEDETTKVMHELNYF